MLELTVILQRDRRKDGKDGLQKKQAKDNFFEGKIESKEKIQQW